MTRLSSHAMVNEQFLNIYDCLWTSWFLIVSLRLQPCNLYKLDIPCWFQITSLSGIHLYINIINPSKNSASNCPFFHSKGVQNHSSICRFLWIKVLPLQEEIFIFWKTIANSLLTPVWDKFFSRTKSSALASI